MGSGAEGDSSISASAEVAVAALSDAAVVRRYLLSVTDPDLVFDDRQRRLASEVEAATDVLERLSRTGALFRHQQHWRDALEAAFVARGGRWARDAGGCADSMARLGVPADTLEAAGLR
ncbi:MAG: hypothetical protein IT196_06025 [Acidimicrobiales bacterium]|nr:hypothetical protein [Acidimicrobiales bacterium]